MVKTLVEARSMNQSQPKKKAPVLKAVVLCQRALLTQGEKPIVAKETLSSEAKETLSSEAKENIIKWSQRKWTASTKYKIRNMSRAPDKTCNRRIKNEKQEHKTKTMQ